MSYLCDIDDLVEGVADGFSIGDTHYIVVKANNSIFVFLNQCPHQGIPLNWLPHEFMDSDNELIRCSTHGALFSPSSGRCVEGPCIGDSLTSVAFVQKKNQLYIPSLSES